jgi:PAS domain-containing protein
VSVRATTNQRPADQSTETRCWRIRGAAERNSLGQPRYLSGVAQDVTSERAARLALLGELGELRELRESFEALPTAVALINESGVIQRSNRRWQAAAAALALDDGLLDVGRDYLADWQQLAPAPETRVVERLRALLGGAEFEFTDVVTVSLAHAPLRIGIAARRFVIDGKTQLAVIHDYLP